MNGGPSGFNNAPVTKLFVIASAIFTFFFGIQGAAFTKLALTYQDFFSKLHLWKLVVSVFAFSSTPELLFSLYLLYYFRVFERQIGSNKYLVFILFSVVVSLLFEFFVLALLKDPTENLLPSGPYGLIFASYVPFYLDIPISTRFRVFGIHFSDKTFIYLAGLQLLLSSWKRSVLPGICGIIAGSLYCLNLFGIQKAKLSWPSTGSPRGATTRNVVGSAPSYTGHHVEEAMMDDAELIAGDKLILRGLKFHGFHGVKQEERTLGQKFVIDIDAWMDLRAAGKSDLLSDTISYTEIYRIAKDVVEGPPQNLLESVAQLIASATLTKFSQISAIRVKVGKPHVAVHGSLDYLGVEILRRRSVGIPK